MTLTLYTHMYTFIYSISCMYLPCFRSQALKGSESIVFTFYRIAYVTQFVTQFDFVVKQVKVNPGLSSEQTLMYMSPQYNIPSFMEINPLVLEKKIFKVFLLYMGVAAILVN